MDGGNGTVVYCHRASTTREAEMALSKVELREQQRCAVVDWLAYFQFGVPSVGMPEGGTATVGLVRTRLCSGIRSRHSDEGIHI